MVPADERALLILERTPVPEAHKQRLADLVKRAQADAAGAGAELQAEFGREHVALIVGCNQFIRLFRGGPQPGAVELLLDAPQRDGLAKSGFDLKDPEGQVFKLFGWKRLDPMQGPAGALDAAVDQAFAKAKAADKKR